MQMQLLTLLDGQAAQACQACEKKKEACQRKFQTVRKGLLKVFPQWVCYGAFFVQTF